jgi:hypothetical protein
MNRDRIQIPQDEKKGRILNVFPAAFSHKPSLPQPIYQTAHGNDEKKVGELMGIDALYAAMTLGRQCLRRDKKCP